MSNVERAVPHAALDRTRQEIATHKSRILEKWNRRASTELPAAGAQRRLALLDSLPMFLDRLSVAVDRAASPEAMAAVDHSAREHGHQRAELPQYSLDQVLVEYRFLREAIVETLQERGAWHPEAANFISDAIESGMAAAAKEFLRIRELREEEAEAEARSANWRLTELQKLTVLALEKTTSIHSLMVALLDRLALIFRADSVAILLLDETRGTLVLTAARGLERDVEEGLEMAVGQGVAGKIFEAEELTFIGDTREQEIVSPTLRGQALTILGMPLRIFNRKIGVIHVSKVLPAAFSEDDRRLFQLVSDRIATAIDNARLFEGSTRALSDLRFERYLRKHFTSILTHDIRNPLTAAKLSAELLERIEENIQVVNSLGHRIVAALSKSDQLIQDLLDINKILSNQPLSVDLTELELTSLLQSVVSGQKPELGDRFIFRPTGPIPGRWDRRTITRLFELLLAIAVQFGDASQTVVLTLRPAGATVLFSIRFDGDPLPVPPTGEERTRTPGASPEELRFELTWKLILGMVSAINGALELVRSGRSNIVNITVRTGT